MTELEQYKKAYATLVGQVDEVITDLEAIRPELINQGVPALCAGRLTKALQDAEEIFLDEDAEEE